jgi:hypothetical protein
LIELRMSHLVLVECMRTTFNLVGDFNEANAPSELSAHTNWDRTLYDSSMITPLKPSGGERWRFEARRVPVKGFAPGWTRRRLPLAHLTPGEHP